VTADAADFRPGLEGQPSRFASTAPWHAICDLPGCPPPPCAKTRRRPGVAACGHATNQKETFMQWTQPAFEDLRFGFEITMYIASR